MGERLAMAEAAVEAGDAALLAEFSPLELWELSLRNGMRDEMLDDAIEALRLAGICLLDPGFDERYGRGCRDEDLWLDDLRCAFPDQKKRERHTGDEIVRCTYRRLINQEIVKRFSIGSCGLIR